MTANNSKSYLGYLNKLVDEYNNTYHRSIGQKHIETYLSEETETNPKSFKFKVGDTVRITKYKNIFSKGYTKSLSREIIVIDFVFKTNPWTYKIKNLNRKTTIGSFYEKELLLSKL